MAEHRARVKKNYHVWNVQSWKSWLWHNTIPGPLRVGLIDHAVTGSTGRVDNKNCTQWGKIRNRAKKKGDVYTMIPDSDPRPYYLWYTHRFLCQCKWYERSAKEKRVLTINPSRQKDVNCCCWIWARWEGIFFVLAAKLCIKKASQVGTWNGWISSKII